MRVRWLAFDTPLDRSRFLSSKPQEGYGAAGSGRNEAGHLEAALERSEPQKEGAKATREGAPCLHMYLGNSASTPSTTGDDLCFFHHS